jgi:hypothetical protein
MQDNSSHKRRSERELNPERKATPVDWVGLLDERHNESCSRQSLDQSECVVWNPNVSKSKRPVDAFILRSLLSQEEIGRILKKAESLGFGTTDYDQRYRGNLRLVVVDRKLAAAVYERMRPHLPASVQEGGRTWKLVGLNECWRLAKYYPGDSFEKHVDASFRRFDDEKSMYTVNLYLNADFEGGTTGFYGSRSGGGRDPGDFRVVPHAGTALVFRQPPHSCLLHDGEEVNNGVKYLMRTDAMYRRG